MTPTECLKVGNGDICMPISGIAQSREEAVDESDEHGFVGFSIVEHATNLACEKRERAEVIPGEMAKDAVCNGIARKEVDDGRLGV